MVMVDLCGGCGGMFLDRSELDLLETIYETERAAISREESSYGSRMREFLAGVVNRFRHQP